MFLMSRKIKALGVKMVLSGEGSDEVFGGYLYFHKAPNKVRQTAAMGPSCTQQPLSPLPFYAPADPHRHCQVGKYARALSAQRLFQGASTGRTCPALTRLCIPARCYHPQEEFQSETVRKLQDLYKYDCLRANKATMAWGVEARVPFLDKAFLEVAMAIDPAEKMIDKSKGAYGRNAMGHAPEMQLLLRVRVVRELYCSAGSY